MASVTIPDSVTVIERLAFDGCSTLTSITIPDSVTYIGDYAFLQCSSLSRIILPRGITTIENSTFSNCYNVSSVTIPDSITVIGDCAFELCTNLTSITIPGSVETIGSKAFMDCTNLTDVALNNGLTTIGTGAFSRCEKLHNIRIPDSVTTINDGAFFECSSLTRITIPESVIKIEPNIFNGCSSLQSVILPNSITTIPGSMFNGCTSLSSINIPDSIVRIEDCAFQGCESLTSIAIPESVAWIDYMAFSGCINLNKIYMGSNVSHIDDTAFLQISSECLIYCAPNSITWNWFVNNGFEDKLVEWDGIYEEEPEYVTVSGTVTSANGTPIQDVYVILRNIDENDYRTAVTDYNGSWSMNVIKNLDYEVGYTSFDYVVTGTETSITATDGLTLTATTAINAEVTTGISFTMKQSGKEVSQIIVGSNVDFEVTAPESASAIRLIVDGIAYDSYALNNGTVTFTRSISHSGTRNIQIQAYITYDWLEISNPQVLQVTSSGQLGTPVIDPIPCHYINHDLQISWSKVENATSYTVYVYSNNIRVWPEYGKEITDARTENTYFTIPADAFKIAGDYCLQVVTSSAVIDNIGYDTSTGFLEPLKVYQTEADVRIQMISNPQDIGVGDTAYFALESIHNDSEYTITVQYPDNSTAIFEISNSLFNLQMNQYGDYYLTPHIVHETETYDGEVLCINIDAPEILEFNVNSYSVYAWECHGTELNFTVKTNCTPYRVTLLDNGNELADMVKTSLHQYKYSYVLPAPANIVHNYTIDVVVNEGNTHSVSSITLPVYCLEQDDTYNEKLLRVTKSTTIGLLPGQMTETVLKIGDLLTGLRGKYQTETDSTLIPVQYAGREYFVDCNCIELDTGSTLISNVSSSLNNDYITYTDTNIEFSISTASIVDEVNTIIKYIPEQDFDSLIGNSIVATPHKANMW